MDSWESTTNRIYTPKDLPNMLTKMVWKKWEVKKYNFKSDLAKIKMPDPLRGEFVKRMHTVVEVVLQKIETYFPNAHQMLKKELDGNLSCLKP